jgi:hypothetical protein
MPAMTAVDTMLLLTTCKSFVKLPSQKICDKVDFCESVMVVHNNESET